MFQLDCSLLHLGARIENSSYGWFLSAPIPALLTTFLKCGDCDEILFYSILFYSIVYITIVHFPFSVRGAESFIKILIMKNMIWNKNDQFTLKSGKFIVKNEKYTFWDEIITSWFEQNEEMKKLCFKTKQNLRVFSLFCRIAETKK